MTWDQVEGKWKQLRGSVKQKWGNLTDDDLDQIAGTRDRLVGKLQERYGIAREEALRNANAWIKMQDEHERHASHVQETHRMAKG